MKILQISTHIRNCMIGVDSEVADMWEIHKAAYTRECSSNILQEYGILPHSRTYYCLLFSLYHMFIVFVISY